MKTPLRKYPPASNIPSQTQGHLTWMTNFLYSLQDQVSRKSELTKEHLDKFYGPAAIRPHLLGGGQHSLTIDGMLGIAAQAQTAEIPITVGTLAHIPTNLTTQQAGEIYVAVDVGHLFVWTGSKWAMQDGSGQGVFAPASPLPTPFWVQANPAGGTVVNVTKADGTGTTAVTFPSYAISAGYSLWVRI